MNHTEDDEYLIYSDADKEQPPEATVRDYLQGIATFGLALLSMLGGIVASLLAISELLYHQPDTMQIALQLSALPHSLLLLLEGFICQALVAFGLFTFQLHRQVRAVLPGMALTVVVAVLLLVIRITA